MSKWQRKLPPAVAGALVAFIALWVAHARGLHFAGVRPTGFPLVLPASYGVAGRSGVIVRLGLDWLLDDHVLFRVAGGHATPDAWKDQVFSRALPFYLSELLFNSEVLGFVFALAIICVLRELLR